MTTDPAILAQLQAAWGRAAIVAQQPPMRCMVHIDERRWLDEPPRLRPHYLPRLRRVHRLQANGLSEKQPIT